MAITIRFSKMTTEKHKQYMLNLLYDLESCYIIQVDMDGDYYSIVSEDESIIESLKWLAENDMFDLV